LSWQVLAFYDFPAEHWKHLLTSNPIECSFTTSATAPCEPVAENHPRKTSVSGSDNDTAVINFRQWRESPVGRRSIKPD
jgi:transposase-like protein